MKTILLNLLPMIIFTAAYSQSPPAPVRKVVFNYDASGNRIQRYIENPTWLVKKTADGLNGDLHADSLLIMSMDSLVETSAAASVKKEALHMASMYEVSVYPNPTNDLVRFSAGTLSEGRTMRLSVYDHAGKLVCSVKHSGGETIINLTQYADGTYHIIAELPGEEKLYYKIIKADH